MVAKSIAIRRGLLGAILAVLMIQPWLILPANSLGDELLTAEAAQCADILGIRDAVTQIVSLRRAGAAGPQLNELRAHALRKILQGALQVQIAENYLEMETAYTYDVLGRARRKVNTVDQMFNIANFLQAGVLSTIVPYSRIDERFIQAGICVVVSGSVGLALPVMNILYDKTAKAHNLTPPDYFAHVVDGKPVDGSNLPPYVARYLDTTAPGTQTSRRAALNVLWNQRYDADLGKKETLCGIDDGKPKSLSVLNSRIVLLWSLYTAVQGFDNELLALLDQICDYRSAQEISPNPTVPPGSEMGTDADEAERLLHLEPVVAELRSVETGHTNSERTIELQLVLMEKVLAGYLDMRIAADKCQAELNYQYDVVLAHMMERRDKFLQKTFDANFIQANTLGTIAGYYYMRGNGKVGDQLSAVANSVGIFITTVSLMATQGGWRKNESWPNTLADFFELRARGEHGLSPLAWNFLNDTSKRTGGKTRRAYLLDIWKSYAVTDMDLDNQKNREKLGSMPSCKRDTINLVNNRIALLTALREQFGHFDEELLALIRKTWPKETVVVVDESAITANAPADSAAKLLGDRANFRDAIAGRDSQAKVLLTRDVLEGFLDGSTDADTLGLEIVIETHVMNRMIRQRDMAVQLTNILNFYQIGILGVTSNALSLSSHSQEVLASNRVAIVSGYMASILALVAVLEQHGGLRPTKAQPNLLSNALGVRSESVNLSPLMVRYLDSPEPTSQIGLTRRQELVKYWTEAKVLCVNIKRKSAAEKLSAEGNAHHWWDESIKLINNRISMLYDLRAVLRASNIGFNELLTQVN